MSDNANQGHTGAQRQSDFFVSYTEADRVWAEWIAWELEEASYVVEVQAWDFRPGNDFVHAMHAASQRASRTIAVLSDQYLTHSPMGEAEWRVPFAQDPGGEDRLLIPVRVQDCRPTGLLASRIYIDLVGLNEPDARARLVEGVRIGRARPMTAPGFPGLDQESTGPRATDKPVFPGVLPSIFEVPFRGKVDLWGREDALQQIAVHLGESTFCTLAITGTAGVGKTQLAVEYAYTYASRYNVIWWVTGESQDAFSLALAALGDVYSSPVSSAPENEGAPLRQRVENARRWLQAQNGWLLVIDNLADPAGILNLLPRGGAGAVLITSRLEVGWTSSVKQQPLSPLGEEAAAGLLVQRSGDTDPRAARELAVTLGGLPLALEQAAGFIWETGGLTLQGYLTIFETRSQELLAQGVPSSDSDTVATVWSLAMQSLAEHEPAAAQFGMLSAFFASDDIPMQVLRGAQGLPEPLASTVVDPLGLARTVYALRARGLIKMSGIDAFTMHVLQQQVMRASQGADAYFANLAIVAEAVRDAYPQELTWNHEAWPQCRRLHPHVLAVASLCEQGGVGDLLLSPLLDRAGTFLQAQGQYEAARDLLERALAMGIRAHGPASPVIATPHDHLGRILQELGDLGGARQHIERSVALTPPEEVSSRNFAARLNNLASVLQAMGDLKAARTHYERSLEIDTTLSETEDLDLAVSLDNLGGLLLALNDAQGSQRYHLRALDIFERLLPADHPTLAVCHNNLGRSLQALGDLETAEHHYQLAHDLTLAALGREHPRMVLRLNNLGSVLMAQQRWPEARARFEAALALATTTLGPEHETVAMVRENLVRALEDSGD